MPRSGALLGSESLTFLKKQCPKVLLALRQQRCEMMITISPTRRGLHQLRQLAARLGTVFLA